ncbi:MAG: TonB-dependent receptor [Bacteroidetes bacterium]|nr:MAG: TonB-dependent receptor [Bacteroidota bacterium]
MPLFIERIFMKRSLELSILFFVIFSGLSQKDLAQGLSYSNGSDFGPSISGTLSGQVLDKAKSTPIPGASVLIPDLKLGAIADSTGHFHFGMLPSGTYLVEVHSIGYKTLTETVVINGSTVVNFGLMDQFVEESPVVVTGLSKATQIKRSPVPIIAINHQFINTNLSTNIIDAIAKVPGVSALTTGPNVSKPFIRGLGYNRILTLYDGVRQEGQQWGDEHGIEVDQYGIDRIEVIKGPASLSYGSDALAGVVNLIPTPPAPEGKMVGNLTTEYQTNNGMFGGSAMLGATKNGFEWMGRISHKKATNYQNSVDGRVFNTAYNETDGNVSLGLHRAFGYSHLSLSIYDALQQIPDGSRDSASRQFTKQITEIDTFRTIVTPEELRSYSIAPLHQHVQHYRVYSTNNFTIGNSRLGVNLGFQRSVRREFSHPEEPYQDVPGLYLQLNSFTYDVKYYLPSVDGWDFTVGLDGMYQDNTVTNGTDFVIPSYRQFDIGPFALIKKTIDKLDISGGIRFDTRSFHNDELYTKPNPVSGFDMPVTGADTVGAYKRFNNYDHNFAGISGSLGATYNFTDHFSVKANIARGFRAPNIAEISSNGVHPGTNIFQIGNSSFKPEFNLQEDLGISFTSKYLEISFSVFNNTISNYIFNQRLLNADGGDSVIVPGNQTFEFQQRKAQLYGGELNFDIHPIKALHFENSLSAVYGINKDIDPKLQSDSNKYVPLIPPLHGVSELRYDFPEKSAGRIGHAFVKVQLAYYAKQSRAYLVDQTETPTPGYTLFNAGAGAGLLNKKGKTIFNLYVMGNNLFDVAYQDHLSRLKYFEPYPTDPRPHHGIYNMGRNISLKLEFPLDLR